MIEIWSEGFAATGQSGQAYSWGSVKASTLQEACNKLALLNPEFARYYDTKKLTYWGCRLFDNEQAARVSFS